MKENENLANKNDELIDEVSKEVDLGSLIKLSEEDLKRVMSPIFAAVKSTNESIVNVGEAVSPIIGALNKIKGSIESINIDSLREAIKPMIYSGLNLDPYCKTLKLSKKTLALIMNVSYETLRRYENAIKVPQIDFVIRLSFILNAPLDSLLKRSSSYVLPQNAGGFEIYGYDKEDRSYRKTGKISRIDENIPLDKGAYNAFELGNDSQLLGAKKGAIIFLKKADWYHGKDLFNSDRPTYALIEKEYVNNKLVNIDPCFIKITPVIDKSGNFQNESHGSRFFNYIKHIGGAISTITYRDLEAMVSYIVIKSVTDY